MGSKAKISKYILPIILKDRQPGQWYVEPFMGGCNTLCEVDGNRIGNDSNFYVVEMFKALASGWHPPVSISENEYNEIKNKKDAFPKELVGFVGICLSFGAKWFGGYARNKRGVNFAMEGRKNIEKQANNLKGVFFKSLFYNKLISPEKSIIYCDPPYQNTSKYKDKEFDHEKFWHWCRYQKQLGHQIFISEYNAPEDFKCIWQMELNANMDAKYMKISTEKLFTL